MELKVTRPDDKKIVSCGKCGRSYDLHEWETSLTNWGCCCGQNSYPQGVWRARSISQPPVAGFFVCEFSFPSRDGRGWVAKKGFDGKIVLPPQPAPGDYVVTDFIVKDRVVVATKAVRLPYHVKFAQRSWVDCVEGEPLAIIVNNYRVEVSQLEWLVSPDPVRCDWLQYAIVCQNPVTLIRKASGFGNVFSGTTHVVYSVFPLRVEGGILVVDNKVDKHVSVGSVQKEDIVDRLMNQRNHKFRCGIHI